MRRPAPGYRHVRNDGSSGSCLAGGDAGSRGRHATGRGEGFGRIVAWTILGAFLPGAGLWVAARRRLGGAALGAAGTVVMVLLVSALVVDPISLARRLVSSPDMFVLLVVVLTGVTLAWAGTVAGTYISLRRFGDLTPGQRLLGGALVVALIGTVGVPAVKVGQDAMAARGALTSVFDNPKTRISHAATPNVAKADPWADIPRVNVLLMGGDSGADRTGIRPDTMMVASINTSTGDTLLISLPRNLQRVPFPPGSRQADLYPDGFYCINPTVGVNTECLLNALWTWGDGHPQYYPGDSHPGLTATIQGVEQATGLKINEYVMLNLKGFTQFVDILGGLTVNVQERLPVGGNVEHPVASSWLKPGRQKLNGYLALWYARSRWTTTDYDRMRRQRCVFADLVHQINPVTLALNFSGVAATMKENLATSIPLRDVDAWVTLSLRVKQAHVRSLPFTDQVINTVRPDFERMHRLVKAALNPPPDTSSAFTSPSSTPTSTPTATARVSPSHPAPQAEDVAQVC
jgi:LCP family protein required for cell wall assembly